MRILVIDVGGTNLKVCVTGRKEAVKIPSGPRMTAAGRIAALLKFGLQAHEVVLGGGQTKALAAVPDDLRIGSKANAILGG
jgi:hypothetical protein